MADMQTFEQRVAAEMLRRAGPSLPVDDLAIYMTVTSRTAGSPSWRLPSLLGTTKFVVAGAIVALCGGFLLAGVLTTQPEETRPAVGTTTTPESATTPPIELPAEIPEGIESGTLETPIGPARWVHLTGDESAMPPQRSGLISTPDGYAVPEWGDRWFDDGDAQMWRSSDLIDWTSEPLGIEARYGELSRAADTYWLNVHEPASLWRSPDTKSWEPVSLERLVPPGPDGYAWTLQPGRPLTHGDTTIVPFEWVTDEWVVVRGLPGAGLLTAATLVERAPGAFDIDDWPIPKDNRGTFATVRFEETADGLRVIDHEDGTELKTLDGVSMEFIKLLAHRPDGDDFVDVESGFDEIAWQPLPRLAILDGSTLVEVEPPLTGEPYRQAYAVDEDGFLSITLAPDGLVRMHRSQDGGEWREIDVIGDETAEPSGIGSVGSDRGTVQMGNDSGSWILTDDLVWEPSAPVRFRTEPDFLPIGVGWILGPFDANPITGEGDVAPGNILPRIWYQPAEGEPVPIDITPMALPASVGNCGPGAALLSPNTIASGFGERCVEVGVWIITFDDVPA